MAIDLEIIESWTDYSGLTTGNCPMTTYWVFGGTNNISLVDSTIEPGNRCLKLAGGSFLGIASPVRMFKAPVSKFTLAMGFVYINQPTPDGGSQAYPFRIVDGSGAAQFYWAVNSVGKLIIAGESGAILATSEENLTYSTTYRICMRVEATGANLVNIAVSINGYDDPGLTKTGIDLQANTAGTAVFGGVRFQATNDYPGGNSGNIEVFDLVVGTGECIDWGPVEVIEGPPDVDIVKEWTPLSGSDNFAMVDEAQANGDTDYNSTEGIGNKDIFGFSDPEVPEKIVALGMVSWNKKEDSATRRYRHILRVASVDYPGDDIFCAESYTRRVDGWTDNPNTAAPWEPTDLAPLEFGYEYLGGLEEE